MELASVLYCYHRAAPSWLPARRAKGTPQRGTDDSAISTENAARRVEELQQESVFRLGYQEKFKLLATKEEVKAGY